MNLSQIVGLNTKWYRYNCSFTQEEFASKTGFKISYVSLIETGEANLTCKSIDIIAKSLQIDAMCLFDKNTAEQAKNLPRRVDMLKM